MELLSLNLPFTSLQHEPVVNQLAGIMSSLGEQPDKEQCMC